MKPLSSFFCTSPPPSLVSLASLNHEEGGVDIVALVESLQEKVSVRKEKKKEEIRAITRNSRKDTYVKLVGQVHVD